MMSYKEVGSVGVLGQHSNKSIWTVTELFHRAADAMLTLVFFE